MKEEQSHTRRTITLAFLGALALVLTGFSGHTLVSLPVAHAAQNWSVQVGGDVDLTNGTAALKYFPNQLTISAGDTVNWTFPSLEPHTVTFDNGTTPPLFVSGLVPGPGPGELTGNKIFLPAGVTGSPSVFDPSKLINSGVPQEPPDERMPFSLTFPAPGVYHYECAIHGPGMSADITVLPPGSTPPETPAAAVARGQAQLQKLTADTAAFLGFTNLFQAGLASVGTAHAVDVGYGVSEGMALYQYLDRDITVHQGDSVSWTDADPNEFHTVTFLSGAPPPPIVDVRPQPAGPPLLVFPASVTSPSGGNSYNGQGIVSSGFLAEGNRFTLTINAPPGTYEYVCLLHGDDFNMKGTITVVP